MKKNNEVLKRPCHGGEMRCSGKYDIKYDFSVNVNPLGLPDGVRKALLECLSDGSAFTDYPDTECRALRGVIAAACGVDEDLIVCGGGASDIIWRLCAALGIRSAALPVPAFSEYERALAANGCEITFICTGERDGYAAAPAALGRRTLRQAHPDALFLCSPANPSGKLLSPETLRTAAAVCEDLGALLVVDECFIGFAPHSREISAINLIKQNYSGVIVINAFTKFYAMAGLRLGYAVCGSRDIANRLSAYGPPWSVSGPALAAGAAALRESCYAERTVRLIAEQRQRMTAELRDILKDKGCVFDSDANYILFTAPPGLAEAMAREGVAIRDCSDYRGLSGGYYYRTAVRTAEENSVMLAALRRCIDWLQTS